MRITLKNLEKVFPSLRGPVPAISEVNLEVKEGEFFVILGPSGSGKSTLLNIVAGLEKPTSGEVWFGTTLVASPRKRVFVPAKDRNVAMVFQSYALYPHLNVFENIAFPLRIKKVGKERIARSVEKAASMLDIERLLSAKPGELSGGERQRVAIARAIVRDPVVFLLDEPLSNLDAQLRLTTRGELKMLQRRIGITNVYVTHDQVEAMTLGDRIAVMKDGVIQQVAAPDEIYDRPVNPFVAAFVGSPPMNFMEASLVEEGGVLFLSLEGLLMQVPPSKKKEAEALKPGGCLLGVRPEDMEIVTESSPGKTSLRGKVVSVETLGREKLVHIETGKSRTRILSREGSPEVGRNVGVSLNGERIHLFPR